MISAPTTKFCPACNVTLPADHFSRHGGHKDGLQTKCRSCNNEMNRNRRKTLAASQTPGATKIAKPQKPASKRILEAPTPHVTFPPIKETEYRGQHRTSYSFLGPDDFSVFTFDTFKEARSEREKMRPLYAQTAIYENTHRQSTAARRASAAEGKPATSTNEADDSVVAQSSFS